ncbi:hypothetical protein OPIT5_19950 [Opitutaceae bacterium TAV5]|nr:hypothetical protein OPIT5_19950 [Opitutaceae bacterium TAV5]
MKTIRLHDTSAGFTLIELLTVVAIIGILTAIIIPTVGKVRESARAAQCASNLRQIQLANILYSQDNGGKYAPVEVSGPGLDDHPERKWVVNKNLYGYLSPVQTTAAKWPVKFLCPTSVAAGNSPEENPGNYAARSYGYNSTGKNSSSYTFRQFAQNEIARPSTSLAWADAMDWKIDQTGADKYVESIPVMKSVMTGPVDYTKAVAYRHGSKTNIAFWDAHVKRLRRQDVIVNSSGANQQLWQILQ